MRRLAYRLFWALHRLTIRLSRGRWGWRVMGRDVLDLEHVGVQSGDLQRSLLFYQRDGESLVVVASNAGDQRDPRWLANLLAHPDTHVARGADRRAVHARLASAEEHARLWPQLIASHPPYAAYAQRAGREIPIVILEPPEVARRAAGGNPAGAGGAGRDGVYEPPPTGLFAWLGRFAYRFRRWIPVGALLLLIGLQVAGNVAGGTLIQGGWTIRDSEAVRADALLADRFGEESTAVLVIYRDPDGDAASPAFQQVVRDGVAAAADDPAVDEVITYADVNDERFVSTDGTSTYALLRLNTDEESAVDDAERIDALVARPDGVETHVTGVPILYHEFNTQIEHDLITAELISFPVALVILLVVFGTLVGAVLPLVIAVFAMGSTFGVIQLLAGITDVSIFVNNLASMIGIALAIDYALFLVSRFREELRHHDVETAVVRTMASVGKAVAISGIAVAIGLSSLIVFEAAALRSMGMAGVVVVLSTMLFGLVLLPALLALLGHRVNRLRVPLPGFLRLIEDDPDAADRRQGHGAWSRIAAVVMRRPLLIGVPVLAALIVAGLPFLSLELSTGGNLAELPDTPARQGFEILADEFPGGDSDPIIAAVTWDGADLAGGDLDADRLDALDAYVGELEQLPAINRVESVLTPPAGMDAQQYRAVLAAPPSQRPAELQPWIDQTIAGDTTKVTIYSHALPDSDAGRASVDRVRAVAPPEGAEVLTAGLSSRSRDFLDSFDHSAPVAVLIVVGITAAVLFLTFGSLLMPVKAVLMSLVSVSASFGALVWIFQQGHLESILGFTASGTTVAWLPVIMFAILFGLSMDYEVFLLSRIRERYVATGDNTRAVQEGIGITGGIITGAALIMVSVFAAFALSSIVFLKALGFSMALAVLIDATIVRGILVPAFMRVMGRANWWAPRWVQRLVARVGLYEGPMTEPAPRPTTEPELRSTPL